MSYEDTYNTLKYADRAKSIRVRAERNEVNVNHHVSQYTAIIDTLREEISELKRKISQAPVSAQPAEEGTTKAQLFEHHHLFSDILLEHQQATISLHDKSSQIFSLAGSIQILGFLSHQDPAISTVVQRKPVTLCVSRVSCFSRALSPTRTRIPKSPALFGVSSNSREAGTAPASRHQLGFREYFLFCLIDCNQFSISLFLHSHHV